MASLWVVFINAGWVAYPIVLVAMATGTVSLVALIGAVAAGRSRAWPWVAAAGLAFCSLGLALGAAGTWLAHHKIDTMLTDALADWPQLERIYIEGYREACAPPSIALVLMAVPFFMLMLAAVLSLVRARDAEGKRPVPEKVAVSFAGIFALLGVVACVLASRPQDAQAKTRVLEMMKTSLVKDLAQPNCDGCKSLADAIDWRGIDQLERDVPGMRLAAKKCVADRLAEIDSGKRSWKASCRRDWDAAPRRPPMLDDSASGNGEDSRDATEPLTDRQKALREAVKFGMSGLLGEDSKENDSDRTVQLEKLQGSPLLVDEIQKQQVSGLLAAEKQKLVREKAVDAVEPSAGRDGTRLQAGSTTVTGRLSAEVIQRIVRQRYERFRRCYKDGLRNDPKLKGRISVRFVIDQRGRVTDAKSAGSDFPDTKVVACVVREMETLLFPRPKAGVVTVDYPIVFGPSE